MAVPPPGHFAAAPAASGTGPPASASSSPNNKALQPATTSVSSASASSSGTPELPWIPITAVTSPDNYGRLNPENEAILGVINAVSAPLRRFTRPSSSSSPSNIYHTVIPDRPMQGSVDVDEACESGCGRPTDNASKLLALPSELIDTILAFLSPYDLLPLSATCHQLRPHALSDLHWQALVQECVPGSKVSSPYPCASYCELYAAHDKVWFLPKFKIWFCDRDMTGKIVLARYDQRRGCIEGLQLVAVRRTGPTFRFWAENDDVVIHQFAPRVQLHLENPVLQFNVGGDSARPGEVSSIPHLENSFANEIPMMLTERTQNMYSNFILNKPLAEEETRPRLLTDYPYGHIWPPPSIPAHHHTLGDGRLSQDSRPYRRSQVSDQTFRIRQWLQSSGSVGLRIGDRISAYSTLDPVLYTPTPTKPWRGIWVGDYSGHGCEFILMHQPDDPPATDSELNLVRGPHETNEQWEQRQLEARIYRGRLEAIKLTGDPNVPRGEYTFIADDLGEEGFIGTAEREPFTGTRIVSSKGHVAATGFLDDKFIESQLFLIGPNLLAQYWVEFGHVSYFERVNIDDFLDPERAVAD